MLRTSDTETEILLGNKQLLGIFFAVVILLGLAFYGGYMLGRHTPAKTVAPAVTPDTATSAPSGESSSGGQTHTLPADSSASGSDSSAGSDVIKSNPGSHEMSQPSTPTTQAPLGSRRHKEPKTAVADPPSTPAPATSSAYTPQSGSEYLQVAAISRSEAEGLADVLQKKGFRAHAVPKPGNNAVYRVIVGPIRDAGDLSSTRDALRKTGFREVIVQRY